MIEEQLEANQQPEAGVIALSETSPSEPRDILSPGQMVAEFLSPEDREAHARSLKDEELLTHLEGAFLHWRQNIPYLKVARERFSKPGQRLPIAGNPTWTEWVEKHLGVSIRTVQRLLAEPKDPPAPPEPKPKPFAFSGLTQAEVNEIVEQAKAIGPETVSRLMHDTVVRKAGDLEPARTAVKHCLQGVSIQRQLELLEELQTWVGSQVEDLTEELNKPPKKRLAFMDDEQDPPAEPGSLLAHMQQANAVATCA